MFVAMVAMMHGALPAFIGVGLLVPVCIPWIRRIGLGQCIQEDGPNHMHKAKTPTMGGVVIACTLLMVWLLQIPWNDALFLPALWLLITTTALGMWDDGAKIYYGNNDHGLRPKQKLLAQWVIALVATWIMHSALGEQTVSIVLPSLLFHGQTLSLGWWYYVWSAFVIMGASNAVNLTDGLDGLASVLIAMTALGLGMAIGASQAGFWSSSCVLGSLVGAFLGFFWHNKYPATIFMGDSGSLPAGALLGFMALWLNLEFLCAWFAGVFIVETLSVMIQVAYFKKTRKRFFKMAPLHHHFELCGYSETQVVRGFWFAGLLLLLSGLLF